MFRWSHRVAIPAGGDCPWRRIVIFRQGQLGDTLVAFPLIEALHALWPGIPITYCTNRFRRRAVVAGADVCRLSPYLSGTVTYGVEDPAPAKWRQISQATIDRRHTLLIYLPYAPATRPQILRDWVFLRSLGFESAIGFKAAWRWAGGWQQRPRLPKESSRLLEAVRCEGLPLADVARCTLERDEAWAGAEWSRLALAGRQVLAVCPGSKMPAKVWPIDRFAELGRRWHARTGAFLAVVGGREDAAGGAWLEGEWAGFAKSFCGVSLAASAAVLYRAAAYCGNDTGAMHLAAIQGVPCVALFCAREIPGLWDPFGENHIVLRHDVPCTGCRLEVCPLGQPAPCLARTEVDAVLDALEAVWPAPAGDSHPLAAAAKVQL